MRPKLGVIAGSAFLEGVDLPDTRRETIATAAGDVTLYQAADFVFIRRHGEGAYRPPHRIPHHAHVLALEELGVRTVAGLASSGALRDAIHPGDIVIPDDYISWSPPPTFATDEYMHIVPALDPGVRALLHSAAGAAGGAAARIIDSGVYVQTHGPRFETPAEVRMLARDAHVVGMTAASEATLCQERGLAYAVLCIVDNYANGMGAEPLTLESFQAQLARNADMARNIVAELLRMWREATR